MREAETTNDVTGGPRAPKGGVRSCVGCANKEPTESVRRGDGRLHEETARPLVRLVLGPDREIAVDSRGGMGRGILVHAEPACIAAAVGRGLPRACKGAPKMRGEALTAAALADEIARVYEQRLQSLLATARRAGHLEVGSSAVTNAIHRGAVRLAIVAADAAAAADLTEIRRLAAEGKTIAWPSKRDLALAVRGKSAKEGLTEQADDAGVALVAVCESRIAEAMRETRRISESVRSGGGRSAGGSGEGRSSTKGKREAEPSKAGARRQGTDGGPGRAEGRGGGPDAAGPGPIGQVSPNVDSSRRQTEELGTSSAQRAARRDASGRRDASILVGGAANLRGPGRKGSLGVHPRRRGVKSA